MEKLNQLSYQILGCCYKVHSQLGPGLLEKCYESCLEYELKKSGLLVRRQVGIPVIYDDQDMGMGYRMDLLVDDKIVLEVKAQDGILPIHEAQLLTYLKLSRKKLGFLLNFNVLRMTQGGITRRIL